MVARIHYWLLVLSLFAVFPQQILAQPVPQLFPQPGGIVPNNLAGCDFATGNFGTACVPIYIGYLIKWVVGIVGAFFIINTIFAGYQITIGYATGSGIESGVNRLKSSILGFVVTVLVFVIFDLAVLIIGG